MRAVFLSVLSFTCLSSLVVACGSPPPAEGPRPEAEAATPAKEPLPGPVDPTFTAEQSAQLAELGAVCTAAYHQDATGRVDAVGCSDFAPHSPPKRVDALKYEFGQSWRGHFSAPHADDLVVWLRNGPFFLATKTEEKWVPVRVVMRSPVGNARCQVVHAEGAIDLLACQGDFQGIAHGMQDLVKHIGLEMQANSAEPRTTPHTTLFSAYPSEDLWTGLCARKSVSTSYRVVDLTVTKNPKTNAEELVMNVERSGWTATEAKAFSKNEGFAAWCAKVEQSQLDGLPATPTKLLPIRFTRSATEFAGGTEYVQLVAEIAKQNDEIAAYNRKIGVAR